MLTACLLAVPLAMTMPAQAPTRTTLAALRDTARPLLIFAPADDARIQEQISGLADHAAGLRDRDMRVVVIGPAPHPGTSDLPIATFAPEEQAHARQQFRVAPNDFTVILVGKDGGEKLRSSSPIPWQKLSRTIDSMPMRQDEMKRR